MSRLLPATLAMAIDVLRKWNSDGSASERENLSGQMLSQFP